MFLIPFIAVSSTEKKKKNATADESRVKSRSETNENLKKGGNTYVGQLATTQWIIRIIQVGVVWVFFIVNGIRCSIAMSEYLEL